MCGLSNCLCGEWKQKRFAGHGGASAITGIFFNGNILKYAVMFDKGKVIKGKSNISFGTVKGLLLFVCTHNINKTFSFYKIK